MIVLYKIIAINKMPSDLLHLLSSVKGNEEIHPETQQTLSAAIYRQRFGDKPDVLKLLAESLIYIKWSGPVTQRNLSAAIYRQRFGDKPDVLKLLAESLIYIEWSDPKAQNFLACAIRDKIFGDNPDVLKELHSSINILYKSICLGTYGDLTPALEKLSTEAFKIIKDNLLKQWHENIRGIEQLYDTKKYKMMPKSFSPAPRLLILDRKILKSITQFCKTNDIPVITSPKITPWIWPQDSMECGERESGLICKIPCLYALSTRLRVKDLILSDRIQRQSPPGR